MARDGHEASKLGRETERAANFFAFGALGWSK